MIERICFSIGKSLTRNCSPIVCLKALLHIKTCNVLIINKIINLLTSYSSELIVRLFCPFPLNKIPEGSDKYEKIPQKGMVVTENLKPHH